MRCALQQTICVIALCRQHRADAGRTECLPGGRDKLNGQLRVIILARVVTQPCRERELDIALREDGRGLREIYRLGDTGDGTAAEFIDVISTTPEEVFSAISRARAGLRDKATRFSGGILHHINRPMPCPIGDRLDGPFAGGSRASLGITIGNQIRVQRRTGIDGCGRWY